MEASAIGHYSIITSLIGLVEVKMVIVNAVFILDFAESVRQKRVNYSRYLFKVSRKLSTLWALFFSWGFIAGFCVWAALGCPFEYGFFSLRRHFP